VAEIIAKLPGGVTPEIWFQDEMRVGQKNPQVRQWAPTGTRPRQPADQRTSSGYVFGAVAPERGVGAAVVMPRANTRAMQEHLAEISRQVGTERHAILVMDQASWHTTESLRVPANISIVLLPPKSPELNPVEKVWQYLRQMFLSNRVFGNYDMIVDACCDAWNIFMEMPETVTSISYRSWAAITTSP
jgi:hypothetical protein